MASNGRRIHVLVSSSNSNDRPFDSLDRRPVKALYALLDHALLQGWISKQDIYWYALHVDSKMLWKGPTEKELYTQTITRD